MTTRKKLIEVALPLEAINEASAREKSIRHGHPSTLHLWWARRPLAAARAVIFSSLVDDPDSPDALPAFVEACKRLPKGANADVEDTPRMRLFDFIERLVTWEATTDEAILNTARELIQIATEGNPPPLLDPFAGGGSIPLEAQRLGLEAHASDLNPVAVMINKAQIEIPPRFANQPPVNPRDNPLTLNPSPTARSSRGEGLEDSPSPHAAWETGTGGEGLEHWHITPDMRKRMTEIARQLRKNATPSETILWEALRNRRLQKRKFKRQVDIGAFVVDFYCPEERLAVEVDGSIHALQQNADRERQTLIESLGIRFVRVSAEQVENDLPSALKQIEATFKPQQQPALPLASRSVGEGAGGEGHLWRGAAGLAADVRYYGEWMREKAWERIGHLYPKYYPLIPNPSPTTSGGEGGKIPLASRGTSVGEGLGVRGETVIAWLWARTVKSPNPAVNAYVPLVRSFILSKKKGKECWAKPVVEGNTIRFEVTKGMPPKGQDGTVVRTGATCIISGEPIPFEYIREEGKAGRMGAMLMAIVTEGQSGRSYYAPTSEHIQIAEQAVPEWKPVGDIPQQALGFRVQLYGMNEYNKLFTPRQLVALTTFSDLVAEAREQAQADARAAGLPDDDIPLRDGGRGARAYAEAISVYLAFIVDKLTDLANALSQWEPTIQCPRNLFGRQAIAMQWGYAESNVFSNSAGSIMALLKSFSSNFTAFLVPNPKSGFTLMNDATTIAMDGSLVISTDPPYYDMIGYADLSDFFYVWMRKSLRSIYPDIFGTMLVPKEPELIASQYRHGSKEAANAHFEGGMLQTFGNIRRFISHDYPLTVYYAFKQQDAEGEETDPDDEGKGVIHYAPTGKSPVSSTGWETMLTSLIQSGFSIDGTWPMRTEMTYALKKGTNALASSIVLVCRPRPENAPTTSRRAFVDALRRELPAALQAMQSGNIAPVDLAQASIGPGIAIYSRYSKVLEADGSPLSVRTALGLINAALDEYLAEQDGDIDPDTRFAVAWFEQFGFDEGEFGRADVLARAKNTSVAGAVAAGVVTSGKGKVQLTHWREYDAGLWNPQADRRPTVWEATHHLIEQLNMHGETGSAQLMLQMPPDMAAEARNLAYRLYSICERKGWAEHARDYNALVLSWAGIGEETARLRSADQSGTGSVQMNLL